MTREGRVQQSIIARTSRNIGQVLLTRKYRNTVSILLVALAPVLILATYSVLGGLDGVNNPQFLRIVVLVDIIYVIVVAALIAGQVGRMVLARQRRSAGSRLHMRLTQVFLLIALVPTVVIAIFATITLNFGLEGWFSDRVRNVVGNSLAAAEAYEAEHRTSMRDDTRLLAGFLNQQKVEFPTISAAQFRDEMAAPIVIWEERLPAGY